MRRIVIYIIVLITCSCTTYNNSWWSPAMPYDGKRIYVLKLNDNQYRNHLIVDANDSLPVYINEWKDGCYHIYENDASFEWNDVYIKPTEKVDICFLHDSSFLYPLHKDYYVIYPLVYRKYSPMSHRVTNIAWGDICNYDKDTLQLLEYPYQIPQFQITERMVRESLDKTKEGDWLSYEEVLAFINKLIDDNALERTCSKVYFTETGGYSFNPIE